jgi:hypothetical protein
LPAVWDVQRYENSSKKINPATFEEEHEVPVLQAIKYISGMNP